MKRAASEMYISQPAVTQAILNLEGEYGQTFFERASEGMLLTEVGEIFVRRAERALIELARGCGTSGVGSEAFGASGASRFLTTTRLRAVIALADNGSFEIAARSLQTSRASIQRTVRTLEEDFGEKLFLRSGSGVRFSDSAIRLARAAKLAVRELEHAQEELEHFIGEKVGRMTIGSLPLSLVEVVPLALMRLLDQLPDLSVRVVEGPYRHQLSRLLNGDLDMMVGALRDPAPCAEVRQRPLFTDQLYVAVRRGHPLTRLDRLTLSDTIGYSWVIPPKGTPTRALFNKAFRRRALAEPKRLLEVSSQASLRYVLCGSNRVSLVSRRQIRFEEEAGFLTVLPIDLPEASRVIGLTTRIDWEASLAQKSFIAELERVAEEYKQDDASQQHLSGPSKTRRGAFPAPG